MEGVSTTPETLSASASSVLFFSSTRNVSMRGSLRYAMADQAFSATVIIPCRNAAGTIARAVRTALAQSLPPVEVLVIDDVSTDASAEVAAAAGARVIRLEHRGNAGGARNRGIDAARGNMLAFMDADVEMADDWLESAAAVLSRDPTIVAVGGRIINGRPSLWGDLDWLMNHSEWMDRRARPCQTFPTMAIVYRRDAVGDVRFPESNLGEDMFFACAVQASGGRLWFEPSIAIVHKHQRLSGRQFWRYQIRAGYALYCTRRALDLPGKTLFRFPQLLVLLPHLWIVLARMVRQGMLAKAITLFPWLVAGEVARIIGFVRARREVAL